MIFSLRLKLIQLKLLEEDFTHFGTFEMESFGVQYELQTEETSTTQLEIRAVRLRDVRATAFQDIICPILADKKTSHVVMRYKVSGGNLNCQNLSS